MNSDGCSATTAGSIVVDCGSLRYGDKFVNIIGESVRPSRPCCREKKSHVGIWIIQWKCDECVSDLSLIKSYFEFIIYVANTGNQI